MNVFKIVLIVFAGVVVTRGHPLDLDGSGSGSGDEPVGLASTPLIRQQQPQQNLRQQVQHLVSKLDPLHEHPRIDTSTQPGETSNQAIEVEQVIPLILVAVLSVLVGVVALYQIKKAKKQGDDSHYDVLFI